jgi:hypothetical protein
VPSLVRAVQRAIQYESRAGRAAEIAGWSNGVAAVAAGAGVWLEARSWGLAFGAALVAFVLLRLALAHRVTVWVAAIVGTLSVAAAGGALAWLFSHVSESPAAPPIAAALGALVAGALPGWAYATLARRRASDVPDSLVTPVPSSR